MMKRCYLVRHAQTKWNRENRIQGHSDLPLSPLGEEQAKRLGGLFATWHLRGVFTSGLARSRQTAQAIVQGNGHGVEPVVDHEFAEMHLGDWEGLTPTEVDERFQGAYQQWRERPSTVMIPNAEPLAEFRVRVQRALQRSLQYIEEGDFVIVTHGGVIAVLLAEVLGADYDTVLRRLRLDNAGVTALEFGMGLPHVLWVNWTAHLHGPNARPPIVGGWF